MPLLCPCCVLSSPIRSLGRDRHNRNLFEVLLAASCQPFFDMLEHWIYEGTVEDPYHEFMIEERKEFTKETLADDFANSYPLPPPALFFFLFCS